MYLQAREKCHCRHSAESFLTIPPLTFQHHWPAHCGVSIGQGLSQPIRKRLHDSVYFFEIRGRVLDNAGSQPLPYSSIYLLGKAVGTVTNDNGQFLLKLSSKYLADTLSISCIGYYRTNIARFHPSECQQGIPAETRCNINSGSDHPENQSG